MMNVKFRKLHADAATPVYAKPGDSGFDLVVTEDVIVRPGETAKVPTGLAFEIPQGYEIQVRPRSGVTTKTKLRVVLGTVDQQYRGEVAVMVDNVAQLEYQLRSDYMGDDPTYYLDTVYAFSQMTTLNAFRGVNEPFEKPKSGVLLNLVDGGTEFVECHEFHAYSDLPRGTYLIRKGDRIAQAVIAPVAAATFTQVDELSETERGAGGFGSTGVRVQTPLTGIPMLDADIRDAAKRIADAVMREMDK